MGYRRRLTKADHRELDHRLQIKMGLCITKEFLKELRTPGTPEFNATAAAGIFMAETLPMPVFMAIYYQRVKASRGLY